MERYTNEEFKNLFERFKNFDKQFEIEIEEMYNAKDNGQEYDINSIKDEEVRTLVLEAIELEKNNADEEELEKAALETIRRFFNFDRFTHENWITFVNDEDMYDFQDLVIRNSDDNTQNKILDAMLENDNAFWNWQNYSENVRNTRFVDVLKTLNENHIINSHVLGYVDNKVILDNASELMEICSKDKKRVVSYMYNRIRDEVHNKPELIEKTIEILKDTQWIVYPWIDATPTIRKEKMDLFPQIVKNIR